MNDRERLIELLSEASKLWVQICDKYAECDICPANKDKFHCRYGVTADHLIANGVTFATDNSKWIPVTERLPVCGERVLVLVDSCAVFEAYLSISHKWVRYGSFWIDGVTHWMPLPEPPKGD